MQITLLGRGLGCGLGELQRKRKCGSCAHSALCRILGLSSVMYLVAASASSLSLPLHLHLLHNLHFGIGRVSFAVLPHTVKFGNTVRVLGKEIIKTNVALLHCDAGQKRRTEGVWLAAEEGEGGLRQLRVRET